MNNKLILAILLIISVSLAGCASVQNDENGGDLSQSVEESGAGGNKPVVSASGYKKEITLDDLLSRSELIVSGEVLEKLSEEHTNPDGNAKNYMGDPIVNATAYSYSFRVDEVYKGDAFAGQTIVVKVMNDKHIPHDAVEEGNAVVSELENLYLNEGQSGIFCLLYADHYSVSADAPEDDVGYVVMYQGDGVFERDETQESLYHSKSLTIDLNTLAQDIAAADSDK